MILAIAGLCIGLLPAAAEIRVDPSLPGYNPEKPVTGKFSATGDDDMETLMNAWVDLFRKANPGAAIQLHVGTSATAPQALAAGTDQISFVGRKMVDKESALVAKAWGHEALAIAVAGGTYDDREKTHAELVWVNPANPIRGLTLAELDAIYGEERRQGAPRPILNWGDLGLSGDWADKPIHALRHRSVGVTQFLGETVLKGGAWRSNVSVLPTAGDVTKAIADDRYSVGFAGAGFAKGPGTRPLPIARTAGGPYVDPTLEAVASRDYPLSRLVYIYVNQAPGKSADPLIKEFLRSVLSREGQLRALGDGYLPLQADLASAEWAKLN